MLLTMSDQIPEPGTVGWVDLTVDDADQLRDFYSEVVGWSPDPVSMGDYDDYAMSDPGGTARAGICHRRGVNEQLPAVWMVYFTVSDLDHSLAAAQQRGAEILAPPDPGSGRFAVIKDPAGAVCALYETSTPGDEQ